MSYYADRNLFEKYPKDTYINLLQNRNGVLVTGDGNSVDSINVTASQALSASYALNGGSGGTILTSGSQYQITASWATSSISASYISASNVIGSVETASLAVNATTASYILSSNIDGIIDSSSIALTASNINFIPLNAISASWVSESVKITTADTASYITSSHIQGVVSSASYAPVEPAYSASISSAKQNTLITGNSYTITSSWSNNALSASYITSSNIVGNVLSASYCLSGSYFNNIDVTTYTYTLNTTSSTFSSQSLFATQSLSASYLSGANGTVTTLNSTTINNSGNASIGGYSSGVAAQTTTQVGYQAGTSTNNNAASVQIGYQVAKNATSSYNAVQIGHSAAMNVTESGYSTIIGTQAATNGSNSYCATQIGALAGTNTTEANRSVQVGFSAGANCPLAPRSVQIGAYAGRNSVNSNDCVMIGYAAGDTSNSASFATLIGNAADAYLSSSNITKSIAIGYNAKVSTPNTCVIGGTGVDAVKVIIGGTTTNDTLQVVGNINATVITASTLISNNLKSSGSFQNTGVLTNISNTSLESAPLSAEILTGSLSGSDAWYISSSWTGDFTNGFSHSVGNTTTLSSSTIIANTTKYQVSYVVSNCTAGNLTPDMGGITGPTVTADGTYTFGPTTVSTASLGFTPSSTFNGKIGTISLKTITGIYNPSVVFKDSVNANSIEIRTPLGANLNTIIGINAGRYMTTGGSNCAYGYSALANTTTGTGNVALGINTLLANTVGIQNVAVGNASLQANTVGTNNTALGYTALYNNVGTGNVSVGAVAGRTLTTGNSNTFLGYSAGFNAGQKVDVISSTAIGTNAYTTKDYQVVIGASDITETVLRGNVTCSQITANTITTATINATSITASLKGNATTATTANTASYVNNTNGINVGGMSSGVAAQTTTQVGYQAGTSTNNNAASVQIGYQVAKNVTSSYNSVQIGSQAAMNVTESGYSTIVGFQASTFGSNSYCATQIGAVAGGNCPAADRSVQVGFRAGENCNVASNAVQIGAFAGRNSVTADNSVMVGYIAGLNASTASFATLIGYGADSPVGVYNITKSIAIGYNAYVTSPNTCVIGGQGADAVKVAIGARTAVNTLDVIGNISCSVITASLFNGTASYSTIAATAISASYAPGSPTVSSSYTTTASYSTTSSVALNVGDIYNSVNAGRDKLLDWDGQIAKIMNAITASAVVAWIGDSWTNGHVESSGTALYLQSQYGDAGRGFIPAYTTGMLLPPNVTLTKTGSWGDGFLTHGPLLSSISSSDIATPASLSLSLITTDIVIHYRKSAGGGQFKYNIDGGSYTIIDTSGSAGNYYETVSNLSASSHNLSLQVVSASTSGVEINGFEGRMNTGGVRFNKLGLPGSAASDWAAANATDFQGDMIQLRPNLVILMLGVNDCARNAVPATYKTNIQTIVNNIKTAVPSASIIIQTQTDIGTVTTYDYSAYAQKLQEIAIENNLAFVNNTKLITSYEEGNARSLYNDTVHLNNGGDTVLRNNFINFLWSGMNMKKSDTSNTNTSYGGYALAYNTSGTGNTAYGYNSLNANTVGGANTAIGVSALKSNTSATANTSIGAYSMEFNTIGIQNVAIGSQALRNSTTGSNNVAIGYTALQNNTSEGYNTAVGVAAGRTLTSGYYNTFLGMYAGFNASQSVSAINSTAIGANSYTTKANQVVIGDTLVTETVLRGNVTCSQVTVNQITSSAPTISGSFTLQKYMPINISGAIFYIPLYQ